ncbi:MAG: M48 family metallopeptidase [Bacteriovoracia bacterium]
MNELEQGKIWLFRVGFLSLCFAVLSSFVFAAEIEFQNESPRPLAVTIDVGGVSKKEIVNTQEATLFSIADAETGFASLIYKTGLSEHMALVNPQFVGISLKLNFLQKKILSAQAFVEGKLTNFHCQNNFSFRYENGKFILKTLSSFESLSACEGRKDGRSLVEFNPSLIGSRDIGVLKEASYFNPLMELRKKRDKYLSQLRQEGSLIDEQDSVSRMVQTLAEKIALNSDAPNRKPTVHIVNAPIVNAFSIATGDIFLYRGLIEKLENESQLVGVIGHEWAHIVKGHEHTFEDRSRKKILQWLGWGIGGAFVLGSVVLMAEYFPGLFETVAKDTVSHSAIGEVAFLGISTFGLAGLAIATTYSKDHEIEADRLGAQYAWKAGYDPGGVAGMMYVLLGIERKNNRRSGGVLSDHPATAKRLSELYNYIGYFMPPSYGLLIDSSQFVQLKKDLSTYPYPKTLDQPI